MTPRVWVERPIESVEDAEALPVGTIIECTAGVLYGVAPHRKVTESEWFGGSGRRRSNELHIESPGPVRCMWTALVPVEAEEQKIFAHAVRDDMPPGSMMRRFVTPWEPVPDRE